MVADHDHEPDRDLADAPVDHPGTVPGLRRGRGASADDAVAASNSALDLTDTAAVASGDLDGDRVTDQPDTAAVPTGLPGPAAANLVGPPATWDPHLWPARVAATCRPHAILWAAVFNLVHLAGLSALSLLFGAASFSDGLWIAPILMGLPFAAVLLSLRRGRSWVWPAQMGLLCLSLGLGSLPGLIWLPLLIAWCSPPVRDWFNPPRYRRFG